MVFKSKETSERGGFTILAGMIITVGSMATLGMILYLSNKATFIGILSKASVHLTSY